MTQNQRPAEEQKYAEREDGEQEHVLAWPPSGLRQKVVQVPEHGMIGVQQAGLAAQRIGRLGRIQGTAAELQASVAGLVGPPATETEPIDRFNAKQDGAKDKAGDEPKLGHGSSLF